jgi:hypothetical protein
MVGRVGHVDHGLSGQPEHQLPRVAGRVASTRSFRIIRTLSPRETDNTCESNARPANRNDHSERVPMDA